MSRAPTLAPTHSRYLPTVAPFDTQANVSVVPLSVAPGVGSTISGVGGPQPLHAVY